MPRERWLQTVSEGTLAEIDAERGEISRTRWVEEAIRMRLAAEGLVGVIPNMTYRALEREREYRRVLTNAYRKPSR